MSFQSPWLLLTLVLLGAAVGLWILAERRRMRYAVRFTNMDVLATVVSGRSWPRLVPPILFALSLGFLFVGLARPHVERMFLQDRATVILVVDTSRSMQAEDVEPTRLAAAQDAIRLFLDRAPDSLNVGLVVFAGEAQVGTPPTTDHELVGQSIDEIDSFLIYGGTAIGDALQTAVELGKRFTEEEQVEGEEIALPEGSPREQNPRERIVFFGKGSDPRTTRSLAQAVECGGEDDEQGPVSILFLSDGAQTRGILQPLEGAALAQEACVPVYTIALGTPEGTIDRGAFGNPFGRDPGAGNDIPVPPDPETLRQISEMTGGEFSEARTADAVEKAYAKLSSRLGREPGESEVTFLFIALAGGLLLLASAVSVFIAPRLP